MNDIRTLTAGQMLESELARAKQAMPVFKHAITTFLKDLEQRFYEGEDVETLLHARAEFIDQVMQLAWRRFEWHENLGSWRKQRISLVAVGGYGRGELHPNSDVDILILLERGSYDTHRANIQSFLTLLWDIGLEVGHSVRSIKECRNQARADVTVLTALMEARTVCGSDELRSRMAALTAESKIWSAKKFFQAKREEQRERHSKSDHTEYILEPNVKTSPGGLRDIQTFMWIAKRKFGSVTFDDLVALKFITEDERDILRQGQSLLWKIRYGLHLLAGRDDDRLLFENQQKLAELFGYEDNDQLAVEQFMQAYYRTALAVNAVSELLIQHFEEEIIQSGERPSIRPINERFQVTNNYIEVTSDDVFIKHPPALLELFVVLGNDGSIEGTRASTIRLIRSQIDLIDDKFRNDPEVTQLFMELLGSSEHLFSQLRRMERYGILGAYLPEFGHVIGQMQFDLFHIYTVDAHTLQVVRNMRRFRYKNQEQLFPIAAYIFSRLPKVELLYIAGLYHDIAKGQGGDHSELGVRYVEDFCRRHHLGTWDTNLLRWLVLNHLKMSYTAQRRDISDPEVIKEFAEFVGDQVRLDYLYTLTVADINATNPTLWNSWRASLMRQLYVETRKVLRHGVENYVDKSDYVADARVRAIARLEESGLTQAQIHSILDEFDEDYFLRESISDIVWHVTAIKDHDLDAGPLILIRNDPLTQGREGATHIFLYAKKRDYVFAAAVSALDVLNVDVVDARIGMSERAVFDTFIVLESGGHPVGNQPGRIEQIRSTLAKHIMASGKVKPMTHRRTPRALKQFGFKTEVTMSHDFTNEQTILEVVTPDRPGLLAVIANIFVDMDIVLQSAKITTLGERVEDVFYIVDKKNMAISYPDLGEVIKDRICEELDHHVQEAVV
ncbi:MAG TPA: [protein-PII] uridylyltransferase [Pseudomonadales bacterium]|nr:[protein-PII] uridylyltransferase [Pseudomonadales bacterium]